MFTLVVLNFLLTALLRYCNAQGHFQNVALGKSCSQSSYYANNRHSCSAAINGDTSGIYNTGPNCIHSDLYLPYDWNPYWQVDLGQSYQIHHMVVWGRTEGDTITRMSGCKIKVDGDLCYTFGTVSVNHAQKFDITCSSYLSGRVIRVEKNTSSSIQGGWHDDYSVNMCEFQVYVCSDGYWGSDCDRPCGCPNGQTCDKATGLCPPVNGEWGPWPMWGPCSKTCGGGSQSRSRQCDHPAPANGGADCPGNDTETQDCNALPCQVGGSDPQTDVPVVAIASGAAVGGVVVTAAIFFFVIFFVFARRRGRNTHDASGTDGHAHRKTSSATSPEGGTTTDDNYEDVTGLVPTSESHRRTNPDPAAADTSSTATSSATAATASATVYQNVGDDAATNYESLDVSTVGQTSVYTKLKKPKK